MKLLHALFWMILIGFSRGNIDSKNVKRTHFYQMIWGLHTYSIHGYNPCLNARLQAPMHISDVTRRNTHRVRREFETL